MKVRLFGFTLNAGHSRTSLTDLFHYLHARSGVPDLSRSNERRIYFDGESDPTFARGLVVTVRDQKAFLRLIEENGNLVINVETLRGEDKLMEFNFFLINKSNGVGLYQQYFHSCSVGAFGGYLKSYYRQISDDRMADAVRAAAAGQQLNANEERRIRRAHRGSLEVATLVHRGTLEAILSEFQKIKSFEYEFAELEAIRDVAQPLSPFVRRRKETVTFIQNTVVAHVAQAIQRAVDLVRPRSGRVHVETIEGDLLSIQLENVPENFGEYDFDDVAQQLDNLDIREFSQHQMFQQLIDVCELPAYRPIFHARIRN